MIHNGTSKLITWCTREFDTWSPFMAPTCLIPNDFGQPLTLPCNHKVNDCLDICGCPPMQNWNNTGGPWVFLFWQWFSIKKQYTYKYPKLGGSFFVEVYNWRQFLWILASTFLINHFQDGRSYQSVGESVGEGGLPHKFTNHSLWATYRDKRPWLKMKPDETSHTWREHKTPWRKTTGIKQFLSLCKARPLTTLSQYGPNNMLNYNLLQFQLLVFTLVRVFQHYTIKNM